MNIGIIGSGNVGGTLGTRWARNGHRVVFATRDPSSTAVQNLAADAGPTASVALAQEAASSSAVLLVSTPANATASALAACGDLTGKIVIDATNPLLPTLNGLSIGTTTSAAEELAAAFPSARVVKAFNTVGYNIMADPTFEGHKVAMFYCGDDAAAKSAVASLIAELGFDALDAGPLSQARLLEPFALLWITLALKHGYTREIGFELLRR